MTTEGYPMRTLTKREEEAFYRREAEAAGITPEEAKIRFETEVDSYSEGVLSMPRPVRPEPTEEEIARAQTEIFEVD
jgi:hypothetical protein